MKKPIVRWGVILLAAAAVAAGGFRGWKTWNETPDTMALTYSTGDLTGMLTHGLSHRRINAALALGQKGDAAAVPALLERLGDRNEVVRKVSALALGRLGDERAVPPLIAMLDDPARLNRATAAFALGQLRDERAVEPLGALLADPEWTVRQAVCNALGALPSAKSAEFLRTVGNDENVMVRQTGLESLSRISRSPGLKDAGLLADSRLLQDPDPLVRVKAVNATGLSDPAVVDTLFRLLEEDPHPGVREKALYRLWALPEQGGDRKKRLLDGAVAAIRQYYAVRWVCTEWLVRTGDTNALERMALLLQDPDPAVRKSTSGVFMNNRPAGAEPFLVAMLEHSNAEVRTAASGALANYKKTDELKAAISRAAAKVAGTATGQTDRATAPAGGQADVDAILEQSRNWDPQVRIAAINEMYRWNREARVTERLLELLKDQSPDVVCRALSRLTHRQDPRIKDAVLALTKADNPDIRRQALTTLRDLDPEMGSAMRLEALKAGTVHDRYSWAAGFLNKKPLPREMDELRVLFMDADFAVAAEAAGIVFKFDDGNSKEATRAALKEWTVRWRKPLESKIPDAGHDGYVVQRLAYLAASYKDREAVPDLIESLHAVCEKARIGGALALGEIGDPRGIPPLLAARTDPDREVRHSAMRALGYFRTPEARQAVERGLKDDDPDLAGEALEAKLRQAVSASDDPDLFVRSLADGHPFARDMAIARIFESGDTNFLPRLLKAYGTTNDVAQPLAFLNGLMKYRASRSDITIRFMLRSGAYFKNIEQALVDDQGRALLPFKFAFLAGGDDPFQAALAKDLVDGLRGTSIEKLQEMARTANPAGRMVIAEALCRKPGNRAFEALLAMADDPDPAVMEKVLGVMAAANSPRTRKTMLALSSNAPPARAAVAARFLKKTVFYPPFILARTLENRDPDQVLLALKGLPDKKDPLLVPPLLKLVVGGDTNLAEMAIAGLSGYNDPQIPPALIPLLTSPAPVLRLKALATLGEFNVPDDPDDLWNAVADALGARLADPDPALKKAAREALEKERARAGAKPERVKRLDGLLTVRQP